MNTDSSAQDTLGAIRYNEDVIKTMVTMALSEVEGVAAIENRTAGNLLSRKSVSNINKIIMDGKNLTVDLAIVVKYGLSLRDAAQNVQRKVQEKIEAMTDLKVNAINVNVAGLDIEE
jgi:uncharacterized alkaline shock family protein YloU